MSERKILIVIYQNKLGGAENQALQYAVAINRIPGYSAEIIYCLEENDPIFNAYTKLLGVVATYIPPFNIGGRNFLPKLYYISKLRKRKPYGLISFTTMPNLYTGLVAKYVGAKFFFWNQLDILPLPDYIHRKYFNEAYKNASAAITNAQHIQRFLSKEFPVNKPFHLIGNAIDVGTEGVTHISLQEQYGIPDGSTIVTMLANLQPNKDHLTVLKALLTIPEHRNVHVVFIGYLGALTSTIINFINKHRLRDRVTLCGQVENVQTILEHTDLLIHSSRSEGMSVAVLEAVLCGIPVIPTRIAGNMEIFGDDYQYYFEPGNEKSLLQALIKSLDEYQTLSVFTKDLKAKIDRQYSLDAMQERLTGIFAAIK